MRTRDNTDYERVARAIRYLMKTSNQHPSLKDLSGFLRLSEFHCQRIFRDWAGITPKDFLQFIALAKAKKLLSESESILETSYEVGLSGPGRLHDLFVKHEAMSPGEYKEAAKSLAISWGQVKSPLGVMSIATTPRGICSLTFGESKSRAAANLKARWPLATIRESKKEIERVAANVLSHLKSGKGGSLKVLLKGTPFQVKIWEALLRIPVGTVASYQEVAHLSGKSNSVRAVSSAIATNPVGFLIPCHRVIRSTGVIGDYRWGSDRKTALLAFEHFQRPA